MEANELDILSANDAKGISMASTHTLRDIGRLIKEAALRNECMMTYDVYAKDKSVVSGIIANLKNVGYDASVDRDGIMHVRW